MSLRMRKPGPNTLVRETSISQESFAIVQAEAVDQITAGLLGETHTEEIHCTLSIKIQSLFKV